MDLRELEHKVNAMVPALLRELAEHGTQKLDEWIEAHQTGESALEWFAGRAIAKGASEEEAGVIAQVATGELLRHMVNSLIATTREPEAIGFQTKGES